MFFNPDELELGVEFAYIYALVDEKISSQHIQVLGFSKVVREAIHNQQDNSNLNQNSVFPHSKFFTLKMFLYGFTNQYPSDVH